MGKKTDTITNIGDLLCTVYADRLSAEGIFIIDDEVVTSPENEIARNEVELACYPVSNRLSEVFDVGLKRRDIDLLTGESAGRTGSILHDVLARANTPEEVENELQSLLTEGVFKEDELESLNRQAISVLEHSGLQQILKQSAQTLNEKSIIDASGKSYRPDKVLIEGNTITIIDYKFTQKESDTHVEQVNHYRSLLLAMGYAEVKTYLFYAVTGQLKLV
ncbi:MAG: hypothetical protein EOO01_27445 [Chitinophagaceae bacterium]|nr:MAG: hypothetical protein EOO01_27445 [Chitinophagaceae bacterium]